MEINQSYLELQCVKTPDPFGKAPNLFGKTPNQFENAIV